MCGLTPTTHFFTLLNPPPIFHQLSRVNTKVHPPFCPSITIYTHPSSLSLYTHLSLCLSQAIKLSPKSFCFGGCFSMAKRMRCMHNMVEVAPAPLITCQRSSSSPSLETIVEEGSERSYLVHKTVLNLLPVFLSFTSYFLMKTYV